MSKNRLDILLKSSGGGTYVLWPGEADTQFWKQSLVWHNWGRGGGGRTENEILGNARTEGHNWKNTAVTGNGKGVNFYSPNKIQFPKNTGPIKYLKCTSHFEDIAW
jgi:hypothetical protein